MKSSELNKEVRKAMAKKGVRRYEVANHLKIAPNTFQHWLMSELSEERKNMVMQAINEISFAESKK